MERAYLELSRYGRVETVVLGLRLTVGRAGDNDLPLATDQMVSQRHAIFERVSAGWQVRDLNSTNGTYVNGTQVERSQPLSSRDEIMVGGTRLLFWLEPASESDSARTPIPPQASADGSTRPLPVSSHAPPPGGHGYLEVSDEWGEPGQVPSVAAAAGRRPPDDSAARSAPAPSAGLPGPVRGVAPVEDRKNRGRARLRGIARNVHRQQVAGEGSQLTFRLESYDGSGNRMPPVAVDMRHNRSGVVSDGDEVDVTGKWSKGTLQASAITNVTTNSQVLGRHKAEKAVMACGVIFFICFFLFVIGAIVTGLLLG